MTLRLFPVLALAAATIAAQQPFKSGAQTVVVYATVTDSSGHIVTDLTRDRFEVYDGGKAQTITTFANDVQPITVVMMLDRSVSMLHNFSLVEEAAGTFVDRLGSSDKARIGSFSNRIEVDPRDFSSDKEELRHILKTELQDPGPTPLWNAMGVGMTALCKGAFVTPRHMETAAALFGSVGRTVAVDEKHMDAVTALSASGPAYIYIILESLAEAGVKVGLPRDVATLLAAQTVLGASTVVLETGDHPALLKDAVTTPAGCTIDGILELEEGKLRVTLIKAVVKATQRAKELANG